MHETIIILDFGSQVTKLIARRVREHNVYCEIHPFDYSVEKLKKYNLKGIILSGGPMSVYEDGAPICSEEIYGLGVPVLGICYGYNVMAVHHGGEVNKASRREYGNASLNIIDSEDLFNGIEKNTKVWMSHGDALQKVPDGFDIIANTENAPYAAIKSESKSLYGIQFHPEVIHTDRGKEVLGNFLYRICKVNGDWTAELFVKESIQKIRKTVGDKKVVCGLSGGVDSSVTAVLLHKAIGDQLTCIFVDNGLLRKNERERVEKRFHDNFNINLVSVDASDRFLDALKGVTDPEKKRKIIGNLFIEIFDETSKSIGKIDYLAQGTLYPDVIESTSVKGPSASIKSHHNVGGLPEKMNMKLVEPLRELFKDEVRKVGKELSLTHEVIGRHPFPGPGLAVRILGDITREKTKVLQDADFIFIEELRNAGIYDEIWQALMVLLPVKTVGVMGDQRTYENVAAIRAVTSQDGMTADWYKMPHDVLGKISNRIINEVRGINRVVYDVSSKPPATIEWE